MRGLKKASTNINIDEKVAVPATAPVVNKDSNEYRFVQNLFDKAFEVNLPFGTMQKFL